MNSKMNTAKKRQDKAELLSQKMTEAMMAELKTIHSAASPDEMDAESLNRQRKSQEVLGRLVSPPIGFSWEPFALGEMPMAWVRPERGHDKSKVILYCHGGGYTSGNLGYARVLAAKMASVTGYEVLAFQYRLAPEAPYPAALEDALEAWEYLMHQGWGAKDVIVVGDSAGGNLALELMLELKAEQRFLPSRLILFSPWTDMTASGGFLHPAGNIRPDADRKLHSGGTQRVCTECRLQSAAVFSLVCRAVRIAAGFDSSRRTRDSLF